MIVQTKEQERLHGDSDTWKRWGPYLSERAWGTVREDYSEDGNAWQYFPHDHARSRTYRWNEDGQDSCRFVTRLPIKMKSVPTSLSILSHASVSSSQARQPRVRQGGGAPLGHPVSPPSTRALFESLSQATLLFQTR